MQPFLANSQSKTSKLQPITPRDSHPVRRGRVIAFNRELSESEHSNDVIHICVPNSTATIILRMVGVAEAIGALDFSSSGSQTEQDTLDRSFARLSAFTLEPDQPTDQDVIGKPVYRFPSR